MSQFLPREFNLMKNQLKHDEGFRPTVYTCTQGVKTVGYGRNIKANWFTDDEVLEIIEHEGISKDLAQKWLVESLNELLEQLDEKLECFGELNVPRKAVLVNMAYNIGIKGLMGFKKMLAAIDDNDFEKAASEMLDSRWANQVPIRAQRLTKQMRSGNWVGF